MKKKIKAMLQDGRLAGNAAFERLHKHYLSAKSTFEKSREASVKSQSAYHSTVHGDGKKNKSTLLPLRSAARQDKHMKRYNKIGVQLAAFHLSQWLKKWAAENPQPHEAPPAKQKSSKPRLKKEVKPTQKRETLADKKMPKATG